MARLRGTSGDDRLIGADVDDTIWGGIGNDDLQGYGGDDAIDGGRGDDRLQGGDGQNFLRGRAGNDELAATGWDDGALNVLRGDRGGDFLSAYGSGYTRMEGGPGNDRLTANCTGGSNQSLEAFLGRGDDTFTFSANSVHSTFAQAKVRDFTPGQDQLWLTAETGTAVLGCEEVFRTLDTDGNRVLDGNDPGSRAFQLGGPEHGIGMFIGDDALVVILPQGVEALTASDFSL